MATPGVVCIYLAETLGIPPNATHVAWRTLRENGHATHGGRGKSAAHIDAGDASMLLAATVGKLPLKSGYESWKRFNALPARTGELSLPGDSDGDARQWKLDVPELRKLKVKHSFGDALEALVAAAISGSLQSATSPRADNDTYSDRRVEVRFFGPFPQAQISIWKGSQLPEFRFSQSMTYSEMPSDFPELLTYAKQARPAAEDGDMTQITTVGTRTIMTLGQLLRVPEVAGK
ncbi:hypothetical protein FNL55_00455 [Tardiphaga sp. vice352]|uniref:hypothetical protein n=1 Tax=unclassified Tardiphaga TaxID=2631404 RepID=UPI0011658F39|nr:MULTISPECIES: hypothetical protein [unclassified Tardiphaga]QDM14595.1 hypothetical protein FNL53_00460 [Tardiphaga sp. vice278]QDM29983.1 hypothetical protein FNL55_00455 [Tardiphaga sp. vice352]